MELEPNVRLCCALLKRVSKTETGNPTCPDSRPLLGVQGPGIHVHAGTHFLSPNVLRSARNLYRVT